MSLYLQCNKHFEVVIFQGQRVNPFKKLVYASEHWGSRKTIGDYFSFNGYKKALSTSFHENVVSEKTRDRLGPDRPQFQSFDQLDSRLLNSLKNLGLTHPTNIQQLSLRDLLKGINKSDFFGHFEKTQAEETQFIHF